MSFVRAFANPPRWVLAIGVGGVLAGLREFGLPELTPTALGWLSVAFIVASLLNLLLGGSAAAAMEGAPAAVPGGKEKPA